MSDMTQVRDANCVTALELLEKIPNIIKGSTDKTSPDNLRWMMAHVVQEIDTFPLDKMGRWIGFVQGVLALSGFLDVDEERNKTRARYHEAYNATGQSIPETKERP